MYAKYTKIQDSRNKNKIIQNFINKILVFTKCVMYNILFKIDKV